MNNKAIAFYCPDIYPIKTGGLELNTYYLLKEFTKNHPTVLFTSDKNIGINNTRIFELKSRIFFLRRFYLSALSHLISLMFFFLLNKRSIKIIHVPHTNSTDSYGLIFPIIKFLFKIEYIVYLHCGNAKEYNDSFLNKKLMNNAKHLVTVSSAIANEYQKKIKKEFKIIPSLIPFNNTLLTTTEIKEKFGFINNSKIILMVGSIVEMKGNKTVLKAFIELKEKYILENNLHLVFAGSGKDINQLQQLILENNMQHYVHLLGNIKNDTLCELYKIADLYIIASEYESLSISMLEAMFNKIPIIASNKPVLNSIIINKQNGILFNYNDIFDLKSKIELLIEDKDLSFKIANNAQKEYFNKYSYGKMISDFKDLYLS